MDTRQLQINTGSSASKLTFYQHHYFLGSKLASNFHNSVRYELHRNKFLAGLCLDLIIHNCNKAKGVGTGSNFTQGHTP